MKHDPNENCLSYWYPRLVGTGVNTPRTRIVYTDLPLIRQLDGVVVPGFGRFCQELAVAVTDVGGPPAFLRTGQGSGKHEWGTTCHVVDLGRLASHVNRLVEWSNLVSIMGLPTDVWAVRELLPLQAEFRAFNGLPIGPERRWFFRDGAVLCHHSYWPTAALREAHHRVPLPTDWQERMRRMNRESPEEIAYLTAETERVAKEFSGFWSLDWAMTENGSWYAIDMARGEESWHPKCPPAVEDTSV